MYIFKGTTQWHILSYLVAESPFLGPNNCVRHGRQQYIPKQTSFMRLLGCGFKIMAKDCPRNSNKNWCQKKTKDPKPFLLDTTVWWFPRFNDTPICLMFHRSTSWYIYCWWKKSCTTWHVWNPINNGIFTHIIWCRIFSINSMKHLTNTVEKTCDLSYHLNSQGILVSDHLNAP